MVGLCLVVAQQAEEDKFPFSLLFFSFSFSFSPHLPGCSAIDTDSNHPLLDPISCEEAAQSVDSAIMAVLETSQCECARGAKGRRCNEVEKS